MADESAKPRTGEPPPAEHEPAGVPPAGEVPAPASPPESGSVVTGATPAPEPMPLEVPLEEQITALPPLVYPGGDNQEFDRWAAQKRRNRVRLEVIGAIVLLLAGVAVAIVSGRPAFVAVALFCAGGVAVYEFLVSSFE